MVGARLSHRYTGRLDDGDQGLKRLPGCGVVERPNSGGGLLFPKRPQERVARHLSFWRRRNGGSSPTFPRRLRRPDYGIKTKAGYFSEMGASELRGTLIGACLLWLIPMWYIQSRLHPNVPAESVYPTLVYTFWAGRLDKPDMYLFAGDWSLKYLAIRCTVPLLGWFGVGFGFIQSWLALIAGGLIGPAGAGRAYLRRKDPEDFQFWKFHVPWVVGSYRRNFYQCYRLATVLRGHFSFVVGGPSARAPSSAFPMEHDCPGPSRGAYPDYDPGGDRQPSR